MRSGGYHFWLGASADADPATQATPGAAKEASPPSGECPLRVWGEWSPTAMVKVRLCDGVTFEGPAHEFNWTGERHPTTIVAVELPEFKA